MHETINHQIMNNEIPTGKLNNDDTQSNEKDIIANHLLIIFIDNRAIIIAQQSNMNMILAVFFHCCVRVSSLPVLIAIQNTSVRIWIVNMNDGFNSTIDSTLEVLVHLHYATIIIISLTCYVQLMISLTGSIIYILGHCWFDSSSSKQTHSSTTKFHFPPSSIALALHTNRFLLFDWIPWCCSFVMVVHCFRLILIFLVFFFSVHQTIILYW